jgi:hypothetical protein
MYSSGKKGMDGEREMQPNPTTCECVPQMLYYMKWFIGDTREKVKDERLHGRCGGGGYW